MPWTPADAKRHKRGLSPKQARQWAAVANSVLSRCLARGGSQSRCEASAVRQANGAVGAPVRPTSNTVLLTVNTALTVAPQRLQRNSQDYLVAPCVMLVAGVLNDGLVVNAALVPDDWNHVPIVVNHPADATGQAISARQPDVLDTCGIGHVFRAHLGQGRRAGQLVSSLVGELWINLADAARCSGEATQAVQMLEAQQPLEVSTAFYPDVTPTPGVFHGTPYAEVYTRLRPDHLALLPNAIGACSWQNGGCGAPRLNHATLAYECACGAAACTCDEEESMDPVASSWRGFLQVLRDFVTRAEAVPEPPEKPDDPADPDEPEPPEEDEGEEDEEPAPTARDREIEAAHVRHLQEQALHPYERFILGAPEVYARQTGPFLRLNQTDVDVREALYGCFARELGQDVTPIFIADINVATQTFTYRQGERLCQRGWTVEDGLIHLTDEHTDVQRRTEYLPVPDSPQGPQGQPHPDTYQQEDASMPTTDVIKRRVNGLIANERTRWTEDDRHMLESQNEAFLIRLEQQPVEAPAPSSGPGDPTTAEEAISRMPVHLQETMLALYDGYTRRKQGAIEVLVACKQNPFGREELETMHADRLEKLVRGFGERVPGEKPQHDEANYNGRRVPHLRIITEEGEDDGRPPPLPETTLLAVELQRKRGVRV